VTDEKNGKSHVKQIANSLRKLMQTAKSPGKKEIRLVAHEKRGKSHVSEKIDSLPK